MAYGNRFRFRFDSVHGVEYNIYILKDGYTGTCDQRALGRAPVLKKQKNGPICGTSLDLYAQCVVDGEFAELYTSDPKEYRVDVYRAGTLIWTGFVSTELYSEPSIYPPYDVQIVATDGLGELKQVDFEYAGLVTLSEHIRTALSYTGANKTIYVASSLAMQGESVVDTFGMSINMDYLESKNYYDLLTELLNTLHATITLYGDKWLIARETDIEALLSNGALSVVSIATNGARSSTTISNVVKSVGAMGDADLWPNGNLSTSIDPARREVVVEAPWHNVPVDIEMLNWVTEGDVTGNYTLGRTGANGAIKKDISVDRLDCDIEIVLNLGALRDQARPYGVHEGIVRVSLEYENSHLSDPIEGTASGWGARDPQYTEYNISNLVPRDFTFNFPSGSFSDPGTLRIIISGISVSVLACSIQIKPDNSGYRDTIKIDNGARGKDSAVEVTGSRALSDNIIKKEFYVGLWLYSGDVVLKFADSLFSNGDFLSITALSYATSAALARIKAQGILDVPSTISLLPLLITFEGETLWIDTYEWDLKVEDVTITALSLPSNTLTVESESVTPLPVGYSGSSGSGSSGSGSGAGSGAVPQQKSFFEEDGEGGVKLKDEYDGLWAAGFITAGGVGSGSGGGSSVDLPRVWQSLQNANAPVTPTASTKIAAEHLVSTNPDEPVGLIIGSGLSYDSVNRILSATGGAAGTVSGIKLGTSSAYTPDSSGIVTLPAYPTSLPASDVYSWAKETSKPSYNFSEIGSKPTTISGYGITDAKISNGVITLGGNTITPLTSHQTLYTLSVYGGTTKVLDFKPDANASIYIKAGGDISLTNDTTNKYITLSYSHPTGGANTTISTADGKVLSAITVNSLGHVTSVSSKTLAAADIPDLSGTYLPLSAGTGKALTGVLKIAPSNVSGLQDGIILHDAGTGQNEGLKIKWTSGSYTTGVSLYPNSNLTGLTVDGSLIITAGNYMNYALPLSAGSSYPLTNTLYVSTGNGISDATGNGLLVYHPTSWTGVASSKWGVGAIDCQGVIRSDNTSLLHYRNGVTNASVIYDSDNANKSDVAWACSNLTASGTIHATGGIDSDSYITAGAAATSSDRRMKDNIEAVYSDRALSVLMQLNPCEWEWNDKNAFLRGKRSAGLVAQEVQEILPFAVVDLGDYLYLDYSVFHAYEIKGLQNHEARISTLEVKVSQLLKENEELKARLNA